MCESLSPNFHVFSGSYVFFFQRELYSSVLLENFLEHIGGMLTEHSSVH